MDALLVVDLQNDFCPGGALPVPEGDRIVPVVMRLLELPLLKAATRDMHPPDHRSFDLNGGPWPVHCVEGTEGARLRPPLEEAMFDLVIDKGRRVDGDGYSGFEETSLHERLSAAGVGNVYVCGLALDYCVKATALDAVSLGYGTYLVEDATRAVDAAAVESVKKELKSAGVDMISSNELIERYGKGR